MPAHELRSAYQALSLDTWRRGNPFSADMANVHEVLFDSYATRSDCETQLLRWMQKHQTCLFGKIAAAQRHLHVAILTERDILVLSDEEIAWKVRSEILTWKRRSLRPTPDFSTPGHGFVLLVASQRLADAAPDRCLRIFAEKVRSLWGCSASQEAVGEMFWEDLYLQHPTEDRHHKFTFSVDFFGAQGDGRWWRDHRAPGGILFTANSVGHMQRYRELYEGKAAGQSEWVIQNAMKTIDDAADTEWGRATWLKPLGADGKPIASGTACPFGPGAGVKNQMAGFDWTRYAGFLHSDHSIRPEFFSAEAAPSADLTAEEHLQDFTYLYDRRLRDNAKFMGSEVTAEEVFEVLGPRESWTSMPRDRWSVPPRADKKPGRMRAVSGRGPTAELPLSGIEPDVASRVRLDAMLSKSASWELTPEVLADIGI